MTCELCKRDSGDARFCESCVIAVAKVMASQNIIKRAARDVSTRQVEPYTHYRVQLRGFCCYVDKRDCPNMDEVPAYALKLSNREPWYPTNLDPPLPSEIPYITAATHNEFCDWLKSKEA